MRLLLKRIMLLLAAITVAIFIIEGALRISGFKLKPPTFIAFSVFDDNPERIMAETELNYSGQKNIIYLTDNSTFWKFKPNNEPNLDPEQKKWKSNQTYKINSYGFRGSEFSATKPENTFRIIALGDSVTFGLLVPENNTYHKILEEKLNKSVAPLKVEVISAGIPGYTSYQGRKLLEKELLGYSPDIVMVYFGGSNAYNTNYYTDRTYGKYINESIIPKWLVRKSIFAGLLSLGIKKFKITPIFSLPDPSRYKLRVPPSEFKNDLVRIVDLVKKNKATPILVVPPKSDHRREEWPISKQYSAIVRSLNYLATVIDVNSEFKEQNAVLFTEDDIHPNEAGHQIIADTIYKILVEEINKKYPK